MNTPPIVWSIAGLDTAGGAGLSADQRAADALDTHLCPVLACLTAQNSHGVHALHPQSGEALAQQLTALAHDMPPRAIKTGLLGSVHAIETVAKWVDHFRAQAPAGVSIHRHLPLVVDPVFKASAGGHAFSDERIVQAYREWLLPRATVITPNRAEAEQLLMPGAHTTGLSLPDIAQALVTQGARAVMLTGGDAQAPSDDAVRRADVAHSIDWLHTPHAQGWLTAPRVDTPHHHGTGCTLATAVAAALAHGHVEADACTLGKMLTHHALMHSHAAGHGRGPVQARRGFGDGLAAGGAPLPHLGLGDALPWSCASTGFQTFIPSTDGLYGIVADSQAMAEALQAGWRCLQLRHKAHDGAAHHVRASLQSAAAMGAQLFINDHWRLALDELKALPTLGPQPVGVHLGQEDLLALSENDIAQLQEARHRVMLGVSSHSLWELARAAGCGPSYIACGPLKATTTKDMPWLPQGLEHLAWWVTQSPAPVVGIGGLLTPADLQSFAVARPAALCVVRGLGTGLSTMTDRLTALRAGWDAGVRVSERQAVPGWYRPVLS